MKTGLSKAVAVLLLLFPALAAAQSSYVDTQRKLEMCENVRFAVTMYSRSLQRKQAFFDKDIWNWNYPDHMFSVLAMKAFKSENMSDYNGERGGRWGWAWCMDNYGKTLTPLTQEEYAEIMRGASDSAPAKPAPPADPTLVKVKAKGRQVYSDKCSACHLDSGIGMPPVIPALSGSKFVKGAKADQIKLLLTGLIGARTAMDSFADMTNDDLAAVITYVRNSWGNNTRDVTHPAEIQAVRNR